MNYDTVQEIYSDVWLIFHSEVVFKSTPDGVIQVCPPFATPSAVFCTLRSTWLKFRRIWARPPQLKWYKLCFFFSSNTVARAWCAGALSCHNYVILHCVQKTCNNVFDDKLEWNCPFTNIFGTLITKSIGHRRVFFIFQPHLFSAATLPWEIVKT